LIWFVSLLPVRRSKALEPVVGSLISDVLTVPEASLSQNFHSSSQPR
jgi:hypothetical protein